MMMTRTDPTSPDFGIGPLELWVHGRTYSDAQDYWDGNWLNVTARCKSPGAHVHVTGALVHVSEIVAFLRETERLHNSLQGEALLNCMEPNLRVQLVARERGHVDLYVDITPDHLLERHRFESETDQTYLPAAIEQLRSIIIRHPIRSLPGERAEVSNPPVQPTGSAGG